MRITLTEYKLPCGCVLEHAAICDESTLAAHTNLAELLRYWLELRTRDHVCALVSERNPAGNSKQHARELLDIETVPPLSAPYVSP